MDQIKELNKTFDNLNTVKKNFETIWQDTAKYFRPIKTDISSEKSIGDKKDFFIVNDSTMAVALENFASILNGTLTNKSTNWFELKIENEDLKDNDEILEYLKMTTDKMWNIIYNGKSNFENAHHENLKDFATFGTIAMKIEKGKKSLISFLPIHIKNILIGENDEGMVDTCILLFKYTAKQIVDKFPEGKIHADIKKEAVEKPDSICDIRFYIMPRTQRDKTKVDNLNMPFKGIWFDVKNQIIIEETGFNTFPIAIGRGSKGSNEVYGTGQAVYALPDARSLNVMWRDYFESVQKTLNPPLVVNSQFEKRLDQQPRALNYAKNPVGNGRAVEPLFDIKNVNPTVELILQKQEAIRKIFFLDKLSVLDDPRATATQILELRAESYRIMGSITSSLQQYLESILDRVFDILFNMSYADDGNFTLLPDAPFTEIPNAIKSFLKVDPITNQTIFPKIKIEFINPVNQAQRLAKNNSMDVFLMSILNLAQANPNILDNIDFDQVVRFKGDILQIEPKAIKDPNVVKKDRNAKQQQIAQQQEILDTNMQSNTLLNLNKANKNG